MVTSGKKKTKVLKDVTNSLVAKLVFLQPNQAGTRIGDGLNKEAINKQIGFDFPTKKVGDGPVCGPEDGPIYHESPIGIGHYPRNHHPTLPKICPFLVKIHWGITKTQMPQMKKRSREIESGRRWMWLSKAMRNRIVRKVASKRHDSPTLPCSNVSSQMSLVLELPKSWQRQFLKRNKGINEILSAGDWGAVIAKDK